MKKFLGILATVVLCMSAMGGLALAETTNTTTNEVSTCTIYTLGSESYASCTEDSTRKAQVTCVNDIYVLNNNSQNAGSGGVTVTNNGSAGNVVSGSAVTENGTSVKIGAKCAVATTTPPKGGQGGDKTPVTPEVAQATAKQVVAPVGAVKAGAGGGSHSSNLAIAGLVGSFVALGLGAVLLAKRATV